MALMQRVLYCTVQQPTYQYIKDSPPARDQCEIKLVFQATLKQLEHAHSCMCNKQMQPGGRHVCAPEGRAVCDIYQDTGL